MKMNAKKLTLALIALLLAVTCLFVACKKNETPTVIVPDDKQEEKQEEKTPSLTKEELEKIADQFKKDFKDNYLSLYTDDVVTELEAMRVEAVLRITGAESLEEAQKLADDYIAELKAARTLVDEVKDLIEKIAKDTDIDGKTVANTEDPAKGVSLADAGDVALLSAYNARIENTFLTAAGAQKKVTDAYQAELLDVVKAIEVRLRALKVAKLAASAEGALNDQIAKILKKARDAKPYTYDGEYEKDDTKLTLADYEEFLKVQALFDTFVEMHELVEGTEAYAEIVNKPGLDETIALFAEKTGSHEQIQRAQDLIKAARELAAAARKAARYLPEVDADELVWVNDKDYTPNGKSVAPIYFILVETYENAKGGAVPDASIVNPVKVTGYWDETGLVGNAKSVWVSKSDIYASLTDAWTSLNTIEIMEVYISGSTGANNPFRIQIPNSRKLSHYVLDTDLQAKAEAAHLAATAWDDLLDDGGFTELEESIVNTFYRDVIGTILFQYNASMAGTLGSYAQFAAALVELNYVDEYPVKEATVVGETVYNADYAEYIFNTDTQTIPADSDKSQRWKATLLDEYSELYKNAQTTYEATDALIRRLFESFDHDYLVIPDYLDQDDAADKKDVYKVNIHNNGDGTYTPSIFYQTFAFKWKVDDLSKTEKVVVTPANTKELEKAVLDNVEYYFFHSNVDGYTYNYYKLALAMKAWVEKYIETIPEDIFDLEPFKMIGTDNPAFAFGAVKMTFADEKLEEVAIPQITKLNGEDVNATPSEALDITVYADYNVALAAIAKYDALEAELEETAQKLYADLRALFAKGDADAIATLKKAYEDAIAKYAECVVDATDKIVANSLLEELYVIDKFNYNQYGTIINNALALQNRALALYPHTAWNTALAAKKAAVVAAQAKVDAMNRAIAAFDQVLARAKAYLDYCEAGYKVGWSVDRTSSGNGTIGIDDDNHVVIVPGETVTKTEEVRLISEAQLKEAKQWFDVLTEWKEILTDASNFIIQNDSRVDFADRKATIKNPADPATLYYGVYSEEVKRCFASKDGYNAFTEDALRAALTAVICNVGYGDENTEADHHNYYEGILSYLPEVVTIEWDLDGDGEIEENERVEVALVNYLIAILMDAAKTVEYDLTNGLDSVDPLARATLDKIALDNALAEATQNFNDAKDEFAEKFKLTGKESYADIEELVDLIDDMDTFTHTAIKVDETNYATYDYLNLSVTNEYTENAIDLFSQVFNERIMASYYRAILLTREFAANTVRDLKLADAKAAAIAAAKEDAYNALYDDAYAYAVEQAKAALADLAIDWATEQAKLAGLAEAIRREIPEGADRDAYISNYVVENLDAFIAQYVENNLAGYLAEHLDALIWEYLDQDGRYDALVVANLENDLRAYVEEYLAEGLVDELDEFLAAFDAEWFDYSKNELLRVTSTKTFDSISEGKAAVSEAWRFINSNWEFVETFFNNYFGNSVNYYDAVIAYLKKPYVHATYTVYDEEADEEYEALLVDFECVVRMDGATEDTVKVLDCEDIDDYYANPDDYSFTLKHFKIYTTYEGDKLVEINFTIALVKDYVDPFYPVDPDGGH